MQQRMTSPGTADTYVRTQDVLRVAEQRWWLSAHHRLQEQKYRLEMQDKSDESAQENAQNETHAYISGVDAWLEAHDKLAGNV